MDPGQDAKSELLSTYRAKRSPDRTPEPFGGAEAVPGKLFVVHKHAARRLHFDLRLEMEGVLRSWAVPKGPSYDTHEKRLAVHVEDHPLEYGDFEGMIPEGNYGAGAVIVWDRGEWVPLEDPVEGLRKGKLLFNLKGYKLHGRWTLVKIKKSEKDWLLIKERDEWAGAEPMAKESVLSGLTVEDLAAGHTPTGRIRAELDRLGAPRRRVDAAGVELMLAEPRDQPFRRAGWVFEPKLDGYRILATHDDGGATLTSRNGNDLTASFPDVARAVRALPVPRAVIDGELVIPDEQGRPSFQALQKRARLSRAIDVRRAAAQSPAVLYAFDLLGFEDRDLRGLPLIERKRILRMMLPPLGAIRYVDHFEADGVALMAHAVELGLEGIVGKKADAPYRAGRSPQWIKVRAERTADFVVVGFTAPKGSRGGFGALQLADWVEGELVYAGRAGSGFTDRQLGQVREVLETTARKTAPYNGPRPWPAEEEIPATRPIPGVRGTTWVEPRVVSEVKFKEWTEEGLLRQPVFLRFRDDKQPEECLRQDSLEAGAAESGDDPPAPPAPPQVARPPEVAFSNLRKVFWPVERYTKGDLIEYYRAIAPWLLPYLEDRPLVLTRYPDGIDGKSFYQKDAPDFTPEWIRTTPIWSEDTQRDIRYFVCDSLETLLHVANMGSIPLHIWASRVNTLEQPDWCILDLDPKGAPFEHVVQVARALHTLCEQVELPHFVKTSGSTGLHVMIPLGQQCTYEQSRALGELLARVVAEQLPKISTIVRQVRNREGKVYLDYLQNRHGQLIVAPFSVRPLPGAPVSMPLEWREVNSRLDLANHTIATAPKRMEKLGRDPLRPVLDLKPDLPAVLERLLGKLSGSRAR
jgi:bifunctional non-homologous end joining protein LigD